MTRDQIVYLVEKRTNAMNHRDLAGVLAVYAPDCVVESPLAAGSIQGGQALAKVHQALFDAFSDLKLTLDTILVDGDNVAVSYVMNGTHTAEFMGLSPTGKPFRVPVMTVSKIADGLIVAERRVYDFTGMLIQIGVLKARPA